jgi:hypothetical protein
MPTSQTPAGPVGALRVAAVALLAALAFLPIANWMPGGHDVDWYATALTLWTLGAAIVAGSAVVLAIVAGRYGAAFLPLGRRLAALPRPSPRLAAALLVLAAFAVYALVATDVFSRRPLLIDEVIQLVQARIFEQGRLWLPSTGHPELFGSMHLVDLGGRVYGQFPAGGPALLAVGDALGAAWLVGPACGAIAVAAFIAFLHTTESRGSVRWGAAALFAFAPFTVFQAGSHMNHGFALAALLVATAALARVVRSEGPRPWLALLSGLGYGVAATIRPTDALAFALPAGVWYLARAVRDRRRVPDLLASGLGVALPLLVLAWVNVRTTGGPLLFGYEVLWGKAHNLGFHRAPWGPVHTPLRGLELVNVYLLRLQTYLFEAPAPSLLPVVAALALAPAFGAFDRLLLASSGLLLGVYFAYWHNGFFLGPRFLLPLAPVLALWTARLPGLVKARFGHGVVLRFTVAAFAVAAAIALTVQVPARARQYRNGLFTMRWNADSTAAAEGVRGALVLVRESWGSQVIARMWGLGVTRAETEWLYRSTDLCELQQAVAAAEQRGLKGEAVVALLEPLARDSARVVNTPFSADVTERYLPGTRYPPECVAAVREDREGFTLYAPLMLARYGGNVYVRDLHARDTLALALFPGRPIYLLRPDGATERTTPLFHAARRDSLAAAWGVDVRMLGSSAGPGSSR